MIKDVAVYGADICPACGANWVGEEIPEDRRHIYEGHSTHFKRGPIGVEYGLLDGKLHPEAYDGISEWQCPDCETRWGRWTGNILKEGDVERRFGRTE